MAESFDLDYDPETLSRLLLYLKSSGTDGNKALATALRKQIRNAGRIVQADVASAILSYPLHKRDTGMLSELAASLTVRINSSRSMRRTGAQIVNTGRLLPEQKKALVKAMNAAETFRHPVWHGGNHGNATMRVRPFHVRDRHPREWVEQKSARYFRKEVVRRHESTVVGLFADAINDTLGRL